MTLYAFGLTTTVLGTARRNRTVRHDWQAKLQRGYQRYPGVYAKFDTDMVGTLKPKPVGLDGRKRRLLHEMELFFTISLNPQIYRSE